MGDKLDQGVVKYPLNRTIPHASTQKDGQSNYCSNAAQNNGIPFVKAMKMIPNQITAVRFLAVPVIWVFVLRGQLTYVSSGLVICLVSDLLDGAAARRFDQCTDFGSKFDSLADQLLQLSAVVWIVILMPEIITENMILCCTAIGLYVASLLAGLIKFQRLANLHLYTSKAAALLLFIFLIHTFFSGRYNAVLLLISGGLFILSSAETLTLQLTSSAVDAGMGSILFRNLDKSHPLHRWFSRLP